MRKVGLTRVLIGQSEREFGTAYDVRAYKSTPLQQPQREHDRAALTRNNLGHELGCNTVKRIPAEHALEPAPSRSTACPGRPS